MDRNIPRWSLPSIRASRSAPTRTSSSSESGPTICSRADRRSGFEYDALLLLGDNVYPTGDPSRLPATVFEPFAEVLDGPTQLEAILGNHDVKDGHGVSDH